MMMDLNKRVERLERKAKPPAEREAAFWRLATERERELWRHLWQVGGRETAEAFAKMRARLADEETTTVEDPMLAAALKLFRHVERRATEAVGEFTINELPKETQAKLAGV